MLLSYRTFSKKIRTDFSQKKDIALRRCRLFGLLTKKDIALRRCLLVGVPGRTRTVDIQNHNLTL